MCGSLLALSVGVGCDDSPSNTGEGISQESLVVVALENLRRSMEDGDVSLALSRVDGEYLHQGKDRTALELWLTDLGQSGPLLVSMDDLSVVVERDEEGEAISAQASYILTLDRCTTSAPEPTEEEPEPEPTVECEHVLRCHSRWADTCGWFTHFTPGAQGWIASGDQSPYGLGLHLVSTSDGLVLDGTVSEPMGTLTEVTLDWSDGDEVSLDPLSPSLWQVPPGTAAPDYLSLEGSIPWALEVQLTDADGTSDVSLSIPSVLHSFASDVTPAGESVAPLTFRWSEGDDVTGGARVKIRNGDQLLWTSDPTFATEMSYSGPTLEPGVSYGVEVHTYDLYGQSAVAEHSLVLLDDTSIAPKPTSVTPATGPTTGGTELTVIGSDFLEGVRVDIGSVACIGVALLSDTEVQCTTPVLEEGAHHVAVINPSGAVGLLEEAFYASAP